MVDLKSAAPAGTAPLLATLTGDGPHVDVSTPPEMPTLGTIAGGGFDQGALMRISLNQQVTSAVLDDDGSGRGAGGGTTVELVLPPYISGRTLPRTGDDSASGGGATVREIVLPLPQLGRPVTMEDIARTLLRDQFGLSEGQIADLGDFVAATAASFRANDRDGAIFRNTEHPQGAARISIPADVYEQLERMGARQTSSGNTMTEGMLGGGLALPRTAAAAASAEFVIPATLLALPFAFATQHALDAGRVTSPPPLVEMPPPPLVPPVVVQEDERINGALPPFAVLDSRPLTTTLPPMTGSESLPPPPPLVNPADDERLQHLVHDLMLAQGLHGIGTWTVSSETMSERAGAYQEQITGQPPGVVYLVNGVKFDGYNDGVLLDAKGPGYAQWVRNGAFQTFFSGAGELLKEAQRQVTAAPDTPIVWHVAEKQAADAMTRLLRTNFPEITVVHTPAK